MPRVQVGLVGVGNCASAFVQGLCYYGKLESEADSVGLRHPKVGGLAPKDIQVVAAFDVDERKIGKDLAKAIFAKPNNASKMASVSSTGVKVSKGTLLDGISESAKDIVQVSNKPDADVAKLLKDWCMRRLCWSSSGICPAIQKRSVATT